MSGVAGLAGCAPVVRPTVVPRPVLVQPVPGTFQVTGATRVVSAAELAPTAEYLATYLRAATGKPVPVVVADVPPQGNGGTILLTRREAAQALGPEGYELIVNPDSIVLRAPEPCGVFRGAQTLRQLLDAGSPAVGEWPCVQIRDLPRYKWRGMLLDCGRHFMTKEFVKRYIDLLAYHKFNVLHWHLTEDQGWRIEIKRYPKLTEVGAWRVATRDDEQPRDAQGRYGGFYTQEDIREIVAYAQSRFVTIVPEIEMPGHSQAALASYPELSCTGGPFAVGTQWGVMEDVYCAGNEQTFEFLEGVLTEVLELFPSEYIHIGGDECPKTRWRACPKCQARIAAEGLKDERELQSYFIRRIERFLNGHGRRLVGWDEILEGGLAPNATVQAWRSVDWATVAATEGHDVVLSPTSHCYLDYAQGRNPAEPTFMGFVPLERVYAFEPTPAGLTAAEARHVLGAAGNMWTEHAPQSLVDRQVFPRLCALAEVTWSPAETRDWTDFAARMRVHYGRLALLGVTYYVPPPMPTEFTAEFAEPVTLTFEPAFEGGIIRYTLDGTEPQADSPRYERPLTISEAVTVKARTFLPTGNASMTTELRYKRLVPQAAAEVGETAPGLEFACYEGQWDRVPDFAKLTPVARGVVPAVDLGVRSREENFALRFTGYVEVPESGVYTFYLKSDDGSRLVIGDQVVVDNDGPHAAVEKAGRVMLEAGRHAVAVEFFQAGGAQVLEWSYEGPGIARQAVPAEALTH